MNVEHCDCLSWFSRRCESHKQDGKTLPAQRRCNTCPASGDPAMAFGPSGGCERATARSTDRQRRCRTKAEASCAPPQTRGIFPRANFSTANTKPFNQLLVTPLIQAPKIIENLPALRHKLQQPAPRMIVLDVGLEVIRQVVDPFRKQGD